MKWVTRRHIRVNRTATAWLIRRFVDPDATFSLVDPGEVALVERRRRLHARWRVSRSKPEPDQPTKNLDR